MKKLKSLPEGLKVPAFLLEFIRFHKMEKLGKEGKELHKPKVKAYLEKHKMPGFILADIQPTTKVDNKKAMEWAKKNLDKETYRSLFVRAFDPDKFAELVELLTDQDENFELPEGIITDVAGRKDIRPDSSVINLYLGG